MCGFYLLLALLYTLAAAEEDDHICVNQKEILDFCDLYTGEPTYLQRFYLDRPICASCLEREYQATDAGCEESEATLCPLITDECTTECKKCNNAAQDYVDCLYQADKTCSSTLDCILEDPCESERVNARACVRFAECTPLCANRTALGPCPGDQDNPFGFHKDCGVTSWPCSCLSCSDELNEYKRCASQVEPSTADPANTTMPGSVSDDSSSSSAGLAAGISVGIAVLVSAAIAFFFIKKERVEQNQQSPTRETERDGVHPIDPPTCEQRIFSAVGSPVTNVGAPTFKDQCRRVEQDVPMVAAVDLISSIMDDIEGGKDV